jgi:hypothetical protein
VELHGAFDSRDIISVKGRVYIMCIEVHFLLLCQRVTYTPLCGYPSTYHPSHIYHALGCNIMARRFAFIGYGGS